MNEGPKHEAHGTQTQIGWLGHTGTFYPWPALAPSEEQEPGGYVPVYIDEPDEP
jgi:hypothetical protein